MNYLVLLSVFITTVIVSFVDTNFINLHVESLKKSYDIKADNYVEKFRNSDYEATTKIKLTKKEQDYLHSHKRIKICAQYDRFPYDGFINNKYTGIMGDIYKIISKDLNIEFEVIPSKSSQELISRVKSKECEILSIMPTEMLDFENMSPTKPVIKTYFTIISKLDKSFIHDPEQLEDKILVVQLPIYKKYLHRLYPYLNIVVEEDTNKMIKALLNENVYAIAEVDEKAHYLVNEYGYGKLKINGFLAKEQQISGSIGTLKDEPILGAIIQKELDSISEKTIAKIIDSWRLTRYKTLTDYGLIVKILLVLGLIIFIMAHYQRKLRRFNLELEKQVQEKTKELRAMNESLEQTVREKLDELIQKDKLLTIQSKQAVMGEMISMIAHQWRQPLSTITLQISNLQIQRMMGQIDDENLVNNTLSEISDTIIYLSNTIDDFQTYFHPNKKSEEIEIHQLIHKAISFVLPRIKKEKIELDMKITKNITITTYTNELIQVLLNLLNNAIDSFANVTREKKMITIYVLQNGNKVSLYIEDNGSGILEKDMKKLFEPYFSTKGKNGTGLGLYMSQMLIQKQFNGKIAVQSSEHGSTFIVEINKTL